MLEFHARTVSLIKLIVYINKKAIGFKLQTELGETTHGLRPAALSKRERLLLVLVRIGLA